MRISDTASDQTEASVLHGLGISAFQRGDVEIALKFMARACADPAAPAIWHRNHAEMLDRHGKPEAAEAAARLAVRQEPDCASAWETLGTILIQRGSLEESCDCYTAAVRIDPTFAHAINNLAVALDRLGQLEAAEERYREVLRLVPHSEEIQLNLATLLGELGRHKEGLEIARKVRDCRPDMMRAHALVRELKSVSRQRKPAARRSKRA